MVPAAPPTRKNQRTTSWPAPISAIVPYQRGGGGPGRAILEIAGRSDGSRWQGWLLVG